MRLLTDYWNCSHRFSGANVNLRIDHRNAVLTKKEFWNHRVWKQHQIFTVNYRNVQLLSPTNLELLMWHCSPTLVFWATRVTIETNKQSGNYLMNINNLKQFTTLQAKILIWIHWLKAPKLLYAPHTSSRFRWRVTKHKTHPNIDLESGVERRAYTNNLWNDNQRPLVRCCFTQMSWCQKL